jgi:NADPH-dependent glutamate synthase beta subunit-like oxidoreductase
LESHEISISEKSLRKLLDVDKLKYCFECGICTASCPMAEILEDNYNPRELLEEVFLNTENLLASEKLWFCAWCYRCLQRCPQALNLPEIFLSLRSKAAKEKDIKVFESALQEIVKNVPLPMVTTLICFHPERVGVAKEDVLKKIEQIRQQHLRSITRTRKQKTAHPKVAIIGSGPAGLTVAYELARKGRRVTVLEAASEPGGMLRKCIPKYRLPREILTKEIMFMKKLNVKIITNVEIGKDLRFEELQEEYEAIFIGVGAQKSRKIKIKGANLHGVVSATDLLSSFNSDKKIEVGKNVVIVGGGNVAIDTARTALHLGADKVTILYRRSRREMPANPWETREAENEGVKIEFLISPKKFLGKSNKISAVECTRMQLGEPDDTGRRKATPIEGLESTRETDMVILATGETPDLTFLPERIELDDNGTVWVNPVTYETSLQGVFAGGDATSGPATVIEAIRDGKRAAKSIENHLKSVEGK